MIHQTLVIPAQAGIQLIRCVDAGSWTSAFAGVTKEFGLRVALLETAASS